MTDEEMAEEYAIKKKIGNITKKDKLTTKH